VIKYILLYKHSIYNTYRYISLILGGLFCPALEFKKKEEREERRKKKKEKKEERRRKKNSRRIIFFI
jgi:hypothetical protein